MARSKSLWCWLISPRHILSVTETCICCQQIINLAAHRGFNVNPLWKSLVNKSNLFSVSIWQKTAEAAVGKADLVVILFFFFFPFLTVLKPTVKVKNNTDFRFFFSPRDSQGNRQTEDEENKTEQEPPCKRGNIEKKKNTPPKKRGLLTSKNLMPRLRLSLSRSSNSWERAEQRPWLTRWCSIH